MSDLLPLEGSANSLPVYIPSRNGKICLTEDEILQAGQSARRRIAATIIGSTVLIALLGMLCMALGMAVPMRLFNLYLLAGLLVPTLMGHRAFVLLNDDNQRAQAFRLCRLGLAIGNFLVPFGPFIAIIAFGQPMAICRSMEGRDVDAQIIIAQLLGVSNSYALRTSLGNIYARMGRFDLAEPIFLRRLERVKQWDGTAIQRANAYNNIGWLYFLTGRYKEAKHALEEAIRYSRKAGGRPLVQIKSKVSLCRTFLRLGQIEDAEVLLEETWNKIDARSKRVYSSKTEAQVAFAELRLVQGRLDEALLHAQTAQECADVTSVAGSVFADYAYRLYAQILQAMGRLQESDKILLDAETAKTSLLEMNTACIEQARSNRKDAFRGICLNNNS